MLQSRILSAGAAQRSKSRPPKAGESLREASIVGNSDSVSRAKAIIDHKLVQYQSASRQQLQAQQLQFMQQQRSPQFYQQEQNSGDLACAACVQKSAWHARGGAAGCRCHHCRIWIGFRVFTSLPRQLGSF